MKGRGGRGPVKGAPERLAVQGHHALTALGEAAHEGHKTRLELGRIEQPKHAREGVMAWDAVPERGAGLGRAGRRGGPSARRVAWAPPNRTMSVQVSPPHSTGHKPMNRISKS